MYVYVSICLPQEHLPMHACVDGWHSCHPVFLFEINLSLNPELAIWLHWAAIEPWGTTYLCFPLLAHRHPTRGLAFHGHWGAKLMGFCSCSKYFIPRASLYCSDFFYIDYILTYYVLASIKYGLPRLIIFKTYKIILCVMNVFAACASVLGCMNIGVALVYLLLTVARRGCWVPWNWGCGRRGSNLGPPQEWPVL